MLNNELDGYFAAREKAQVPHSRTADARPPATTLGCRSPVLNNSLGGSRRRFRPPSVPAASVPAVLGSGRPRFAQSRMYALSLWGASSYGQRWDSSASAEGRMHLRCASGFSSFRVFGVFGVYSPLKTCIRRVRTPGFFYFLLP